MHFNYHFFLHLVPALREQLRGKALLAAFSQSKDELVLGFGNRAGDFYVRADLSPKGAHLAFRDAFARARRNSVDLLPDALDRHVRDVTLVPHDRSFFVELEGDHRLLFKLHGRRANVLLIGPDGRVADRFHHKFADDADLDPDALAQHLDQSYERFQATDGDLRALFPTFGPLVRRYLRERDYADVDLAEKWALVQGVLADMARPRFYVIQDADEALHLSLLRMDQVLEETDDPLDATNRYAQRFTRTYHLAQERRDALRPLERRRRQLEKAVEKGDERLRQIREESRYEEWGHLLMANLHRIPTRADAVTLEDFYRDQPVTIPLNPELTPQKNAERLYRKGKNQQREVDQLATTQAGRRAELESVEAHLTTLNTFEDVRALRKYLKAHDLQREATVEEVRRPYRAFEWQGFQIWVGKGARDNDELTQRHSYKEDLWLHARAVAGSHVLVKHQAGQPFPPAVVQKAAELAAWYSKRKTDSLCPVIWTPKKYVRKAKGAAPGQVIVEKERVLMVEPRPFAEV
ncbi:MAG: NFACT RNA binding domain-containing protein [Catalinimonas sp.]